MNRKFALISVFNKEGIVEFAKKLYALDYEIISTGGTAKVLTEAGIKVTSIEEITKFPESFDGRVKTISSYIAAGILFDRKKRSHRRQADELSIPHIDIVVSNLYPFEETIKKKNLTKQEVVEQIDVGGPTMVRAAAKNHDNVLIITDPSDYELISENLKKKSITPKLREELAAKAFAHTAFYDSVIADYLNKRQGNLFPREKTIGGRKVTNLRYGENPHQSGALYAFPNSHSPLSALEKLAGRELSHVNVTDINAGLESVRLFKEPAAVVIKHNSPCGIALGRAIAEALSRAIEADPESAFGGVIVLNKPMDVGAAKVIGAFKEAKRGNMDIVAVPDIDEKALAFLSSLRKSMGIYRFGPIPKSQDALHFKFVDAGFIAQTADLDMAKSFKDWKVVTKKQPTKQQLEQMKIAWKFVSRIRSNAVIIVDKNLPMTRGIGSGQTSRVRSTKLALEQAGKFAKGGILASDSFFPFPDSIELAVKAGIKVVVQQGGSINDQASVDAANKAEMTMVFTSRRAFWH